MTHTRYLNARSASDVEIAAQFLLEGKLVAFPTETVYGLGGLAFCEKAVDNIFMAKNRPHSNPLIIHVAQVSQARELFDFSGSPFAAVFLQRFELLANLFWPGPLTIVGRRSSRVPTKVTAGSSKVAVRVPSHPLANKLIRKVAQPIAAPSANLFTRPSPTSSQHVLSSLDGRIDAVIDGGATEFGIESTVTDIDAKSPKILRHGAISFTDLSAHLPGLTANPIGAICNDRSSPGLSFKHYAPAIGQVQLADNLELGKAWFSLSGIILRTSTELKLTNHLGPRPSGAGPTRVLPDDPKFFARELFTAFYEMEAKAPNNLVIEDLAHVDISSEWAAVRDRILRASRKADQAASFGSFSSAKSS